MRLMNLSGSLLKKSSLIALTLSLLSTTTHAQSVVTNEAAASIASESTPNEETPYSIAGRGVVEKGTGSWIALKCITEVVNPTKTEDCTGFRHIYFDEKTQKITEMGPFIPNNANLKANLKKVGKGYKTYLNNTTNRQMVRTLVIFGLAAAALFVPMFLAAGEAPVMSATTGGFLQGVIGLPLLFVVTPGIGNDSSSAITSPNSVNKPMQDKDGFNWSSKPKTLRKKLFDAYLKYLGTIEGNVYQ